MKRSTKKWVLEDAASGLCKAPLELDAAALGLPAKSGARVSYRRLSGGLSHGVGVIEVDNGDLRIVVVPTRGMGIWKALYRGIPVGWLSPVKGPVNPAFVNQVERGGLGWLAGFDEMIVRCGLESNGAPGRDRVRNNQGDVVEMDLTLHGRIANMPACRVEVEVLPGDPPEIAVTGVVEENMLFGPHMRLTARLSTALGSNAFAVHDVIRNLKATPCEMQMLYHCNFGPPLLGAGSKLVLPAKLTAPRSAYSAQDTQNWASYPGPTKGAVEQCFWHVPLGDAKGWTVALLRNAAGDRGVSVRYDVRQMPCFTQWKNPAAEEDGYVTGLEPAVNYPNPKAFEREQGRVPVLGPGADYPIDFTVEVHAGRSGVDGVEREIRRLQAGTRHQLSRTPIARYSHGV